MLYYNLNEKNEVVACNNFEEWAKNQSQIRQIAQTKIPSKLGSEEVSVSTIFLGIDHSLDFYNSENRTPIVFETMIFGGAHDQYQERYSTYDEAIMGHNLAVALVDEDSKARKILRKLLGL
jgi:hypothetical protein